MQVFKAFFKTVKRQSASLSIYFIIFLALSILLTSNGQSQQETTYKATKVKIAVIDRDNTVLSKSLYNYIDKNHTIVTIKDDKETMSDELFYQNIEYIVIINQGFQDKIKAGDSENVIESVKIPQSVSGEFVDNQINQYLSTLNIYVASGYTVDDAARFALDTSAISAQVSLQKSNDTSTVRSSTYYYFVYIPYVLICILTVGLGSILITFRKYDLNSRIQCSALSITKKNIWLTLSSLLFSFSCWALFMIVAAIMYNSDFFSIKGLLFVCNSVVFLLIAMSIVYFVSYFVESTSTLNMISNILGLGLSFLGGIFVPLEFMSSGVVAFARFLPTYWYVKANQIIDTYTGTSAQISTYLSYIGIEFIFALAIFSAALAASKLKKH